MTKKPARNPKRPFDHQCQAQASYGRCKSNATDVKTRLCFDVASGCSTTYVAVDLWLCPKHGGDTR